MELRRRTINEQKAYIDRALGHGIIISMFLSPSLYSMADSGIDTYKTLAMRVNVLHNLSVVWREQGLI